MAELAAGDIFGSHRIEGLAGRGGMGVVYRATDLDLDRIVALKVIAPEFAEDPDFRARFVTESKTAASIEHPHVIPVYYAGERDGVLFIVMRHVDGPDLRALVRVEGRLGPPRAARIVSQVGGALDAAHAHGLVHRDVKPANVLLGDEDHAYLTDFGLTKRITSTNAGAGRSGGWVGTLGFVAPEQIRGERVDARTDVYALGCVLVHALTGGPPYLRDSDEATLWAHLHAPPPTDRVPQPFASVVERALAKDPAARFPSAGDLGRAALAAARHGVPEQPERNVARGAAAPPAAAKPASPERAVAGADDGETQPSPPHAIDEPQPQPPLVASARARRRLAAAAGAVALAAAALVATLLGAGRDAPRRAPSSPPRVAPAPTPVGPRPDAIALAGGRAWVMSSISGEIDILNAVTGRPEDRVDVGASPEGMAIAAGFGAVWVVKASTRTLIDIGARPDRRRVDDVTMLDGSRLPHHIATGEHAVWVAMRDAATPRSPADSLMRFDPATREMRDIAIAGGARSLAAGRGAVWVANRLTPTVTRIDAADTTARTTIPLAAMPGSIAVGQGAVWVTTPSDRAVIRIDPAGYSRHRIALEGRPTSVAVGAGSVWVIVPAAGGIVRIDPHTLRVRDTIAADGEPAALAVSTRYHALWLALWRISAARRIAL